MTLKKLVRFAADKKNFERIADYVDFCERYLEFVGGGGLQAVIVSQNERQYRFYQYKSDGHFNITRPINTGLFIDAKSFPKVRRELIKAVKNGPDLAASDNAARAAIRNGIYTLQQAIGAALDGLPANESNTARKINGDLFERLIRLLILETGVDCRSGIIQVPVIVDDVEQFRMDYHHDLIIREGGAIKVIGGVKTSSKDRLDKVFVDKFLYSKITGTDVPHIAIFLNDVQRKKTSKPNEYGVNATFLPGHFKGYTIKLNPLDGVYYCDIRPNMSTDPLLAKHIRTIDHFFCTDLWRFVKRPGDSKATLIAAGKSKP